MSDNHNVSVRSSQKDGIINTSRMPRSRDRPGPASESSVASGASVNHTFTSASRIKEQDTNTSEPNPETESQASNLEDEDDHNHAVRTNSSSTYTAAESQQVLRKLDRNLTLLLSLLYLLSFLDRSNIGNARIAGLQTSLKITDKQFDLTLQAFYACYIAFEWMILLYRVVPPHKYIAGCVFAWGLLACLQALVSNFEQLLVLRALLGVAEAAFGPGVPFYMSFFYQRHELAYRVGLQISAAPLATSFAGSLAWLVVWLGGYLPIESWRALFLFEGFPSIVAAVFAFYLIPDSPSSAPWLTPRERKVAKLRLEREGVGDEIDRRKILGKRASRPLESSSTTAFSAAGVMATLLDLKAWLPALMFFSVNISFASLPVFLPTIIKDMSFNPVTSQILAAPPYLFAFVFVLVVGRASDGIANSRGWFLMSCAGLSSLSYAVIAIAGVLTAKGIIGGTLSIMVRYIAVYGVAMGLFASVVLVITWQLNNQASVGGKGVAMVVLNVVGQTGPLVGVTLFPEQDAPYFVKGMAVCAGAMAAVAGLSAGLRLYLGHLNRSAGNDGEERGRYEMVGMGGVGGGEDDGDDDPVYVEGNSSGSDGHDFRYML